jgi:site-specific DNA-methyltransferase (adenine-specific)
MRPRKLETNVVHPGDCLKVLKTLPDESVDLIVTSPPYADRRNHSYGGIHPDHYVEWFVPIALELHRVLKPQGSFILNIKERVVDGERGTYVMDLILTMRKLGWKWVEEYCWHKKNCYPGKWPNRFRDSWERCLHFTRRKNFKMYQEAVMVPIGEWAEKRLKNPIKSDFIRRESDSESGFGRRVQNWVGRKKVYPSNVLHLPTEVRNMNHSAVFPLELPSWFIKLFTREGDVVLDPFMGSGTTALAAKSLNRKYVGIEIKSKYVKLAEQRLKSERA